MPTKVVISDALIIRACNTPGGSGGVYKWIEAVARDTIKYAYRDAPVGSALNYGSNWHLDHGSFPGQYKASFRLDRRGSNGHFLRRRIGNVAPHAGVVEKGRRSTRGGKWEVFTWDQYPGMMVNLQGTSGRSGHHTLERAFLRAMSHKRRAFFSGRIT